MGRKKIKSMFKHISVFIMAVILLITTALPAAAQQSGSITLALKNQNVTFYVYQVGLLACEDDIWQCTLTDDFRGSALALSDLESASVSLAKAAWLKTYADSHGIEPYRKGVSDSGGKMVFSDMPEGLYLFVKRDDTESKVQVSPFLLTMPLKNPEGEGWLYEYAAVPKSEETRPDDPDHPDTPDHPDNPDHPGGDTPGNPSEPPSDETLLVEEPDIPLATVEVPGGNVPLAVLPKTGGDMTAIICACGGVLLIMSGIVTITAGICQPAYADGEKRRGGQRRRTGA